VGGSPKDRELEYSASNSQAMTSWCQGHWGGNRSHSSWQCLSVWIW